VPVRFGDDVTNGVVVFGKAGGAVSFNLSFLLYVFCVTEYHWMMIRSFACADTENLFNSIAVRRFKQIESVARRKLLQLDAVDKLDDLRVPPGNRLEVLKGDRKKQHSIRVNDQWRICFEWKDDGIYRVEIVDYH
jgi:toxin HigB-1